MTPPKKLLYTAEEILRLFKCDIYYGDIRLQRQFLDANETIELIEETDMCTTKKDEKRRLELIKKLRGWVCR